MSGAILRDRTATRAVKFRRDGRDWIARQYRNSEGTPEYFWQVKPADQAAPMPDYAEWKRACVYFEAWIKGQGG